jgi:hypothetical protein
MNALVPIEQSNVAAYRASTDAADMCREIVVATAKQLGDRRYVCVEGWQAIAVAHGCTASACAVERVEGGVRATGQVRRMSDGAIIAEAEGFVGEDEPTWFGGTTKAWKWGQQRGQKIWYDKEFPKRPDYAIRAMAQTRAISRACRSAFAHVVVMMNADLSTTPAEEVPQGGFEDMPVAEFNEVQAKEAAQDRPAAREKLNGPFGSKTALKKAADQFIADLRKAASLAELEYILGAPSTQALKDQLVKDWPGYLNGKGFPSEFEPINKLVVRLRGEMAPADDAAEFSEITEDDLTH